jgi:hypothetical protein
MKGLVWEYRGINYDRKFKAIEAAGSNIFDINCTLMPESFTNFDFTRNPTESFYELVGERCKQIRDKYPYIKLWFSGGTDTTTILNGFLKSNIHIDEIVVYTQSLTNDFNHLGNYELNTFTLPFLKKLSLHLTRTKFTTYYVGYDEYRKILNDKWFERKNNLDIRTMYAPRIRGSNFCNIYGDFSPCVQKVGNRYYDIQWDTTNVTDYVHKNVELFFTSADLPKLHSKQCHIMKNHIKHTNDTRDTKHIAREVVRDTPVAQEHPSMIKSDRNSSTINFTTLKAKAMMNQDPNKDLLDRYKFLLGTTINTKSVLNLNVGFKLFELDLGE